MFKMLAKYRNSWLQHDYIIAQDLDKLIWLIQKKDKINILSLQFMPLVGNKSSGAIFGTFICRFHISPSLSE